MINDLMEMLATVLLPFALVAAGIVLVILLSIILLVAIWEAVGLE